MASSSSKSRAYVAVAAAARVDGAEKEMKVWMEEERQRVKAILEARKILEKIESSNAHSTLDELVRYLQSVRSATHRMALQPKEMALIPANMDLLNALVDLACHPLTFEPFNHPKAMKEVDECDMELESESADRAECYLRQFVFRTRADALECIKAVTVKKPQYRYLTARIEEALSYTREGEIRLAYGGYTVATDAAGRSEDDENVEDAGSFVHALYDAYGRSPRIYTFPALEFPVESVKSAREDLRTSLFETLVVDALGLVCANTMAPGLVFRYILSPATVEDKAKKPKWVLEPEIIRSLSSLNISQSTSKPKKSIKTKEALSPVKTPQSPKRSKGKGKGKAVDPPMPEASTSKIQSSKKREAPPSSPDVVIIVKKPKASGSGETRK